MRAHVNVVRNSVNRGFAAAVNQAFNETATPYVLVLNPDVRVIAGSIELMSSFLDSHPKAGAVGGFVNEKYLPRTFPTAASIFGENIGFSGRRVKGEVLLSRQTIPVDQPAASAIMIRRDAFEEIGGFDERFYPAWYEDVDFCRRLNSAGWEIHFAPAAQFHHEGGYSAQAMGLNAFTAAYYRNQLRYAEKHFGFAPRLSVRVSIVLGLLMRIVARPANAGAYAGVLKGVLGGW
jgi:GT2 family glycosyltransferase